MFIQLHEVEVLWEDKIKKVTLVEQCPDEGEEILNLSRYWIRNALGKKVFIKAKTRDLAQLAVDNFYGKGFYRVNSDKGDSPKGDVTVRATATRKGAYKNAQRTKILNG